MSDENHLSFGRFTLDPNAMRLYDGDKPLPLQPQPLKVLHYLAKNSGRTVAREELRDHVWGDTIVEFDAGLNFCIRQIREALGDDGSSQQYIATVRGKGYRFVAKVASIKPKASPIGSHARRSWTPKAVTLTSVTVALIAFSLGRVLQPGPPSYSFVIDPVRQEGVPIDPDLVEMLQNTISGALANETSDRVGSAMTSRGQTTNRGVLYRLVPEIWVHDRGDAGFLYGIRVSAVREADGSTVLGRPALAEGRDAVGLANQTSYLVSRTIATVVSESDVERGAPRSKAVGVYASDVANKSNASDIGIYCSLPIQFQNVDRFWAIVVKSELSSTFDLAQAIDLPEQSKAPLEEPCAPSRLPTDLRDSDRDRITEGTSYRVFILSDDKALSQPSNPITLVHGVAVRTLVPRIIASGDLFFDGAGNLYSGDWGSHVNDPSGTTLYRVNPETGETEVVTDQLFGYSSGVAHPNGNLYVTSFPRGTVTEIAPDGGVRTFASGLRSPTGIAVDSSGTIFVNQCGSGAIAELDSEGNIVRDISSGLLRCPDGLAIDRAGTLYTCNFNSGNIVRVSESQLPQIIGQAPGGVCAHLEYYESKLYFTALRGNQVFELNVDGVRLIAGSGERRQVDGSARDASFSNPNGVAVHPDGTRLYVTDRVNISGIVSHPASIRVIELPEGID